MSTYLVPSQQSCLQNARMVYCQEIKPAVHKICFMARQGEARQGKANHFNVLNICYRKNSYFITLSTSFFCFVLNFNLQIKHKMELHCTLSGMISKFGHYYTQLSQRTSMTLVFLVYCLSCPSNK
jgi:hypothetical protein